MAKINLTRKTRNDDAIIGVASFRWGGCTISCDVLENAQYLIPDGSYEITISWSPKFEKYLPILNDVPGRTGIRIHTGSKPVHSKGCLLVYPRGLRLMKDYILKMLSEHEKVYIIITTAC